MSEQDEFEKWLDDFKLKQEQRGFYNVYPSRSEVWQACAEQKGSSWEKRYKDQADRLEKWKKSYVEKDEQLEQQAAELKALREELKETYKFLKELPNDLGSFSLNGWRSQLEYKHINRLLNEQ